MRLGSYLAIVALATMVAGNEAGGPDGGAKVSLRRRRPALSRRVP